MSVVLNNRKDNDNLNQNQQSEQESSDLCRIIVDPDIKKKIVLDELSAVDVKSEQTDEMALKNVAGREFPIIRVCDFMVSIGDISKMEITIIDRIPEISLSFRTPHTSFRSKDMPKDGDIISVFIAAKTDTLSSIRNDYVITSVNVPEPGSKGMDVSLRGKLFIPGIEADATYGMVGTSKNLFKETAKMYGIGFATDDEEDTNDKQLWVCPNIPALEFMETSGDHIWKDEVSFYDWWIDQYYNLNFININKMIFENEKKVDITAESGVIDGAFEIKEDYTQEKTKATSKILSNIENIQTGSMYIKKMSVINQSTEISFEAGVEIISKEFLHNKHMYKTQSTDNMCISLSNVPSYNKDYTDTHILLRGRAKYEKEKSPENEQAKANYNYKDIYVKKPWCGISYVMSDEDNDSDNTNEWSGNINKNYTRSKYHNAINLAELDKLYIEVTTPGICTQIMRGESVPVVMRIQPNQEATSGVSSQVGTLDRFYNGYYYVDGIKYIFDADKAQKRKVFSTVFTLKRREWPVPVDHLSDNKES